MIFPHREAVLPVSALSRFTGRTVHCYHLCCPSVGRRSRFRSAYEDLFLQPAAASLAAPAHIPPNHPSPCGKRPTSVARSMVCIRGMSACRVVTFFEEVTLTSFTDFMLGHCRQFSRSERSTSCPPYSGISCTSGHCRTSTDHYGQDPQPPSAVYDEVVCPGVPSVAPLVVAPYRRYVKNVLPL
jgi:hypothetical protein